MAQLTCVGAASGGWICSSGGFVRSADRVGATTLVVGGDEGDPAAEVSCETPHPARTAVTTIVRAMFMGVVSLENAVAHV